MSEYNAKPENRGTWFMSVGVQADVPSDISFSDTRTENAKAENRVTWFSALLDLYHRQALKIELLDFQGLA
jgi:hypothetical protein